MVIDDVLSFGFDLILRQSTDELSIVAESDSPDFYFLS